MRRIPLSPERERGMLPRRGRLAARLRGIALALAVTGAGSLALAATSAEAVVVDMNQTVGQPAQLFGVQTPGAQAALASHSVTTLSSPYCNDPAPGYFNWTDFTASVQGLCWHGGPVMHANETFALTWDPSHSYWALTRKYLEQFLRDVSDGSGTNTSPYALTPQYTDGSVDPITKTIGRAGNKSMYGGGCIDYGSHAYPTCDFSSTAPSPLGVDYPAPSDPGGCTAASASLNCVTDAAIQQEVARMAGVFLGGVHKPDYQPAIAVLLPNNVQVCLDSTERLCSANSSTGAPFCSYHNHMSVDGVDIKYIVQPWVDYTACDEPGLPQLPIPTTTTAIALDAGSRLVNPLSQAQIAAITNPDLNGWYGEDGSETNDGAVSAGAACYPGGGPKLDTVTVGSGSYVLQREENNGGLIGEDISALPCAPLVNLSPDFVVPSPVNTGDVIAFDGSVTETTLYVPGREYFWNFGDGTGGEGPSPLHAYAKAGTYNVSLVTVDRGGNVAMTTHPLVVASATSSNPGPGPSVKPSGLQLTASLKATGLVWMLRNGIFLSLTANTRADGVISVTIPRVAAIRAGLVHGGSGPVTVGRGTVAGLIKKGRVTLHLRLSRNVVAKMSRLRSVVVTVHLALAGGGTHRTYVIPGGYFR